MAYIAQNRRRALTRGLTVTAVLVCLVGGIGLFAEPVTAHGGGGDENASRPAETLCEFPNPEWRNAQTIAGVDVQESRHCRPDNPYAVAAAVAGTNNVPGDVLMRTGYARDAVEKCCDRDGDGDPDVIRITLEINELNGDSVEHHAAPGVSPGMWVFSPKTRGMMENGSASSRLVRAPSPPIRVEQGDTVYVTVENTHYQPHTIHFHGVDHPYETNRTDVSGNDGVPQTSERPIQPGENRTYAFTPDQPGTMFYHCHVAPDVHIPMGLSGMFVVTENESDNRVQTFNVGAGQVRHPSRAVRNDSAAAYDLHYQALDRNLTRIPATHDDPRRVATLTNRRYDPTEASMDYYLLNGRSFPYTLQESQIIVEPGQQYRLRVLNSGPRDVAVHTHGHKTTVEAYDGVAVNDSNAIQRDVVDVAPAQRVDLTLDTTDNGVDAYGAGVWFMHDHHEPAVTTDGISPGGNVNVITYASYLNETTALPRTETDLGRYFNSSYYDGEIPYWSGLGGKLAEGNATSTATVGAVDHWVGANSMRMDMRMTDGGLVVNENEDDLPFGCSEIRGERTVTVRAGERFAEPGEMFAYDRSGWQFDTCTRVDVTLVNTDDVRHQWMVHGLLRTTYPMGMFNLEADGNESVTGTFVTPGIDTRLQLHCSVPSHTQTGMNETIVVGDPESDETSTATENSTARSGGDATATSTPATASRSGSLPTTALGALGVVLVVGLLLAKRRIDG